MKLNIYTSKFKGKSVNDYFDFTINQLNEEAEKDKNVPINRIPVFESPLYYESEYFDFLNNKELNHSWAVERIRDSEYVENLTINDKSYDLYRIISEGYIWDFFISGESPWEIISAFIKYNPKGNIMEIGGLWQIDSVLGLVRGLIMDYYSKHFLGIESDAVANKKGKKFYQNLAKYFIQQGKVVNIIANGKEIPYKLNNAESYWETTENIANFDKRIKFYY